MKILLCYPPVTDEYEKIRDAGLAPHLSLLCLAAYTRKKVKNVEIKFIDGHHHEIDQVLKQIESYKPDLSGFSADFTNYKNAIKLAVYCQEIGSRVILGSNHASNLYKEILTNHPEIDAIVCNDGEEGFVEYLSHLLSGKKLGEVTNLAYREAGRIKRNTLKTFNLAAMPEPAYDLTDLETYYQHQKEVFGSGYKMLQFTSQRGCANFPLCVFCGRYPDGYRLRPPAVFAKEVLKYIFKYSLNEVWDRSDSFLQSFIWVKEFRDAIYNCDDNPFQRKQVTFKTYARADHLIDKKVIDILRDLNFRIVFIGYEAGDDRILNNIGKKCNIKNYLEATANVLGAGMQIDASFIVGLPGESLASLKNHVRFVKRLVKMGLRKIRVNRLLVLPGTPLYRKVVETYKEYQGQDIYDMQEFQNKLFSTDYYDLKPFGGKVEKFKQALEETAQQMTDLVIQANGSAEGYGHGKYKMILKGKEYEKQ